MPDGLNAEHDHSSLWMRTVEMPVFLPLSEGIRADVCIIGAGVAGLTTAYLLMKEGKSVIVLDDGPVAGGMTQYTTAHLSNAIDDRYYRIEQLHGEQGAVIAAASHSTAIDRIGVVINGPANRGLSGSPGKGRDLPNS